MEAHEIRRMLTYHPPGPVRVKIHEAIRDEWIESVVMIAGMLPPSRERSLFITHAQTAMMFANAAIAVHGDPA